MRQKIGTLGWFGWIVTASFAVGGVMALRDFAEALLGGPDTTTRRTVKAHSDDVIIAVLLIVSTAGLVWLAYRYAKLRAQTGMRFIAAWTLMLIGGVLNNLLPSLVTISWHTRTLLTTPLYGIGALLFVWWLVWPRHEGQTLAVGQLSEDA